MFLSGTLRREHNEYLNQTLVSTASSFYECIGIAAMKSLLEVIYRTQNLGEYILNSENPCSKILWPTLLHCW